METRMIFAMMIKVAIARFTQGSVLLMMAHAALAASLFEEVTKESLEIRVQLRYDTPASTIDTLLTESALIADDENLEVEAGQAVWLAVRDHYSLMGEDVRAVIPEIKRRNKNLFGQHPIGVPVDQNVSLFVPSLRFTPRTNTTSIRDSTQNLFEIVLERQVIEVDEDGIKRMLAARRKDLNARYLPGQELTVPLYYFELVINAFAPIPRLRAFIDKFSDYTINLNAHTSKGNVLDFLSEYDEKDNVVSVGLNFPDAEFVGFEPSSCPGKPEFSDWYLEEMDLTPSALEEALASSNDRAVPKVTIAVIDSGVTVDSHPLLQSVIEIPRKHAEKGTYATATSLGYTFSTDGIVDKYNHGTPVAALASGVALSLLWDEFDFSLIMDKVAILPIKVAHPTEPKRVLYDKVSEAITLAAKNQVRIVNLSIRSSEDRKDVYDAISARPEILFVLAAGNDGQEIGRNSSHIYPAYRSSSLSNVIVVGAYKRDGNIWEKSNWSDEHVHVTAPGHQVSTYLARVKSPTGCLSGTSAATPLTSLTAALIASRIPRATPEQIRERIEKTCDRDLVPQNGASNGCRINVTKAISVDTDIVHVLNGRQEQIYLRGDAKPVLTTGVGEGDEFCKELGTALDGPKVNRIQFLPSAPNDVLLVADLNRLESDCRQNCECKAKFYSEKNEVRLEMGERIDDCIFNQEGSTCVIPATRVRDIIYAE